MSGLMNLIAGLKPLEQRFAIELKKRDQQVQPSVCAYRGVRYECCGKPGHWAFLEQ